MNSKIFSHLSRSLLILLCLFSLALAAEAPRLQQISHAVLSPSSEQVVLKLNGSYSPKAFTLKGQSPRLVLDFTDMTQALRVKNLMQLTGPFLKSIRVGMHTGDAPKTRVVFDLKTLDGLSYSQSFNAADSSLTVRFTSKKPSVSSPTPPSETKTGEKPEKSIKKPGVRPSIAQKKTAQAPAVQIPAASPSSQTKPAASTSKDSTTPIQTPPAEVKEPKPKAASPSEPVQKAAPAQKKKVQPPTAPQKKTSTQEAQKTVQEPKKQKAETQKTKQEPQPAAVKQQKPKSPEAPPKPELLSINFDPASPKGEMVMFKLNGFYPPSVHGVEEGIPRVICDFNKTTLTAETKKRVVTDGKYVKALRISTTKKPEKVRVVIDLEPNHSYDLQQVFFKDDNLFVIIVNTIK